ncbi:MAG TPA: hypothetical protein VEC36_02720, partial [Patescibacteria group bacterium]|nr:hypothetical protein [Patescibacteria group bacterium]
MTHSQTLLDSITKEITIIKQLFKKIPTGGINFRPAENMRSTEELLRYLLSTGVATLRFFSMEQNRDNMIANFGHYSEKLKGAELSKFPEMMDEQLREIEELFSNISDEDLLKKQVLMPWG